MKIGIAMIGAGWLLERPVLSDVGVVLVLGGAIGRVLELSREVQL